MAVQAQQLYRTENNNNNNNNMFLPFGFENVYSCYNNNNVRGGWFDQLCCNSSLQKQQQQELMFQQQQQQTLTESMEKERQELDHHIALQNERLRLLLQEQRNQQLSMLLKRLESKASVMFRQKDEEISKASNRTTQLENFLIKLEEENRTWQRLARDNEAMVVSLTNALEQHHQQQRISCPFVDTHEDAASSCGGENGTVFDFSCRSCGFGDCCVVFLPCRHLCCCKNCVSFLDCCLVCGTPKKACIEALI